MSKRPITFPKTSDGVWTNRETGVFIRLELDGSGYRPFRPAGTSNGRIGITQTVRTLAEARYHAARYVRDSARHAIAEAHAEALAEDIERTVHHVTRQIDAREAGHAEALGEDSYRESAAALAVQAANHAAWVADRTWPVRRARAVEQFRGSARAIWRNRADGHDDPETYRNHREAMRDNAEAVRIYDRLIATL